MSAFATFPPAMLTLDWLLEHTNPTAEAIIRPTGPTITTAGLRQLVSARAEEFAVLPWPTESTVLAIACADALSQLVAVLAALQIGRVPLPLDARAPVDHQAAAAGRAGAPVLWQDAGALPLPSAPQPVAPGVALALPTSGASGRPRTVALSGAGIRANVEAILGYLPVAGARVAIVLPLASGYALIGQAFTALRAGAPLCLAVDLAWPSTQLDFLAGVGATLLSSVPGSLRRLAQTALDRDPQDRPPFTHIASAGAPLDTATRTALRTAFPAARLVNQYGLTEASPRVTAVADTDPAFAAGSVGRALPGVTLEIRGPDGHALGPGELGELYVRGPSVMVEYLGDAVATDAALGPGGWLRTRDLGRLDATGALFLDGRSDDLVKVAGERVSLAATSAALLQAPGVDEAYTCALPDPRTDLRLVAFVASALPAETLLPELRRYLRATLAPAARPVRIVHCAALPHLLGGKIDRRALEARAAAEAPPAELEPIDSARPMHPTDT
jgi:acyl-CoA synthetase (AMP-forming)/AMP-acid ligase II